MRDVAVCLALLCASVHQAGAQVVPTYQADAAHTGGIANFGPVRSHLSKLWSVDVGGRISYPVVGEGLAFVSAGSAAPGSETYGSRLYAVDLADGSVRWKNALSHVYFNTVSAYDRGRVFTVDPSGVTYAFVATTGALVWSRQLPGQYSASAPPVARDGVLYVSAEGSGSTLYAVRESNGAILWTAGTNGAAGPILSADGAFMTNVCDTYEFDLADGSLRWHDNFQCSGGPSPVGVFYDDQLFGPIETSTGSAASAFDGRTGRVLASLQPGDYAFLSGRALYSDQSGDLAALDLISFKQLWIEKLANPAGTPPLVVDSHVFVAVTDGISQAGLQVFDVTTGALEQTVKLPVGSYYGYGGAPAGLAAVDGVLLVGLNGVLTALR